MVVLISIKMNNKDNIQQIETSLIESVEDRLAIFFYLKDELDKWINENIGIPQHRDEKTKKDI